MTKTMIKPRASPKAKQAVPKKIVFSMFHPHVSEELVVGFDIVVVDVIGGSLLLAQNAFPLKTKY